MNPVRRGDELATRRFRNPFWRLEIANVDRSTLPKYPTWIVSLRRFNASIVC